MTDVPPGAGRPGDDAWPTEQPGARRSSFQPPPEAPAQGEPAGVDDDALADALAAQVSAFAPPPVVSPPVAPPVVAPPVDAPQDLAPPAAPISEPSMVGPDSGFDDFDAGSAASTLEAIERLESELRRRAEARAAADGTPLPEAFRAPVTPDPVVPDPVVPDPVTPDPVTSDPVTSAAASPGEASAPPREAWTPPVEEFAPPTPRWEIPVVEDAEATPAAWLVEPVAPGSPVEPVVPVEPASAARPPAPLPRVGPPDPWAPEAALAAPPLAENPAAEPLVPVVPDAAAASPAPPPLIEPPTWPGQGAPATGPVDLPPPMTAPVDLPPPPGALPIAVPPPMASDAPATASGPIDAPDAPAASPEDRDPFAAIFGRGDADIVDAVVLPSDADPSVPADAATPWSLGDADLVAPPSQPIATAAVVADDEIPPLVTSTHPAFLVERAGPEPTVLELRAGRATRLFWLNFAATSSVLGVAVGALVLGLGASPRQALVAVLVGVALSFLPLGVVTLASARSGQPTLVVSRAAFGVVGNVVPAILALVSRVYWGGALLWALATGVAGILTDAGLDAGLGESLWALIALAAGGILTLAVAVVGYGLLARVQLVASILAGLLVIGVIVLTASALDLAAAQQIPDGSWLGVLVAGAALVFSVVGLAWVHSAGDLARYQRPDSDGGAGMLLATLGATLPPLALAGWGVLLAASDSRIAEGLATDPLYTIAALLPIWYPAPLLAALAVGLLSGATLTMYSAGFAIQALGLPIRRPLATVLGGVLVLAAAAALVTLVGDAGTLLRDVATTVGVPVAAWAGVFAADLMLRRRRFHGPSLLRRGGAYPAVRVVNLLILLAASAVGFGFSTAEQAGLTWQGYLWPFLGLDDPVLVASDAGVLVAVGVALILALAAGLPAVRRQERADVAGREVARAGSDSGPEAAPRLEG